MTQRSLNSKLKMQLGIKLAGAYAGAKTFIQNSLVPQPQPEPEPEPEVPEPSLVPYTPNGAIADIAPETVTFEIDPGVFVVPSGVLSFSFTDDGVAASCEWNSGTETWDFTP